MSARGIFDEELARRLPLPLAKIYRRAHNAKTPFDRHQAAYFLWEAALRLLASTACVSFAERPRHDAGLAEALRKLARPALGDWWGLVRRLVPVLADEGDPGFQAVSSLILDRSRDDMPQLAELDAMLCSVLGTPVGARSRVRLSELFDRMVRYRNRELGHGAVGHRPGEFYNQVGRLLLPGVAELLSRLDVLAGRRLVYIEEVRLQKSGHYLIERYELAGEAARRIPPLERPASESARLPRPEQVFLDSLGDGTGHADGGGTAALVALGPLLVYDPKIDDALFLNSRGKGRQCNYLCFTSGDQQERDELQGEQRELLARALGSPVDAAEFGRWAESAVGEDEPEELPAPSVAMRRVGEFELLSELGRGSMGIVYRAWQPSLGRQVALKTVSRADDEKARARFRREVRALGRVDHPNLVKIFTSGFDEDPCYYTMELLEGASLASVYDTLGGSTPSAAAVDLATWLDAVETARDRSRKSETPISGSGSDHAAPGESEAHVAGARQTAPPPTPPSAGRGYVRQVVDLMRQVALATQALHAAGVVHRDIKPGNIMLTADGTQAVLMDLGLAQLADDVEGRLTRTRQFLGTLRYASPEQVISAGGIDRRSDIYSLGATLWELVTLRPIYGATDETPTPELMRRIASEDPDRIRKHHPGIAPDLEAIIQKCLEKDPAHRYQTAHELSDDLGRWLRGELVLAQPLTARYVLGKFVRRHRLPIAAAATLVLLAAVGLTTELVRERARSAEARQHARRMSEANAQLNAALHDAEDQRKQAVVERTRAEKNLTLAETRAEEVRQANTRLQDALRDVETRRKEAVTERTHAQDNFLLARRAVDELFTKVSETTLLSVPGAQPLRKELLQTALSYYQTFLRQQSGDPQLRAELAATYNRVGDITMLIGSKTDAIAAYGSAVAAREALARERPGDAAVRANLAESYHALGLAQHAVEELEKSARSFQKALALRRQLAREHAAPAAPSKTDDRLAAARAAAGTGDYAGAHEFALAETLASLAAVRRTAGRDQESRALAEEARQIRERLARTFPSVQQYQIALASSMLQAGTDAKDIGQAGQAKAAVERMRSILGKALNQTPTGGDAATNATISAFKALIEDGGVVNAVVGSGFDPHPSTRTEESLRRMAEALETYSRANPKLIQYRQNTALMLKTLGRYFIDTNQETRAVEPLTRAAAILDELGREHPEAAEHQTEHMYVLTFLGNSLAAGGKNGEAEQTYKKAITLVESRLRAQPESIADRKQLAVIETRLGHLYRNTSRPAEALRVYQASLKRREDLAREHGGDLDNNSEMAWNYYNVGRAHYDAGHYDAAVESHRKAVVLSEAQLREHPDSVDRRKNLAWSLMNMGEAYMLAGRPAEAVDPSRKGLPLFDQLAREQPDVYGFQYDRASTLNMIGRALNNAGRPAEALDVIRKAVPVEEDFLKRWPGNAAARHELQYGFSILGHTLLALGRPSEGLKSYRQALALSEVLAREQPASLTYQGDLAWQHLNVGRSLRELGRRAEAFEAFWTAMSLSEQQVARWPKDTDRRKNLVFALIDLGRTSSEAGLSAEALIDFRHAQSVLERLGSDFPVDTPSLDWAEQVAFACLDTNRPSEAEPLLRATLPARRKAGPAGAAALATALSLLGWALTETGRAQEAEPLLLEAIAIRRKALPPGHWSTVFAESTLGDCLRRLARYEQAEPQLAKSAAALQFDRTTPPRRTQQALTRLAALYEAEGRSEDVQHWRRAALDSGFPANPLAP
jgi:serine/threonine protein kinase/tetratricopeptide (TPR) repeat protein